ncbi:MAG: ATP-binding protein [Ignavibacteria bacterium]|nr:ATP-binding protein [Ignavibacteria bacterium]
MFQKIAFKLILVVSITSISIIGIYSYFNIKSQSEVLLSEVERHANQLSETVKNSTRYDMLLNQRERIQEIINTIGQDKAISSVRIMNKEGIIIYSTNKNDIGELLDKNAESCYVCHAKDEPIERLEIKDRTRIFKLFPDSSRIMGIINPIYNEKSCWESECHAHPEEATVLGVLDVSFQLDKVDAQIEVNKLRELLFALISITAIGLVIGFFVKRWLDKPIKELLKATDQIAVGNFNYTIPTKRNDELGRLGISFNKMTKKLEDMKQQIFQSDKMASLGQLAAGVAHEINNPLTGVLTYSSFLLKRTKDNPEMQEDLNVIVRETLRSREIIKGLLDFARQSVPKKNKTDIHEVIERANKVVINQLKIKQITLTTNFGDMLPQIVADANQIQQVILNLLLNAIDAIEKKDGKIVVTTSEISLSPKGITHIKEAVCNKNHSLLDADYKLEGTPSIRLKVKANGTEGFINLDPIYGRHKHYFGLSINKKSSIDLKCPQCNITLIDKTKTCPECGGPIYRIPIPKMGFLEGCASFNDEWQSWDAVDFGGDKKFIEIKIEDNGCGIPPENLNKIFDPFFSTKGQKGNGLGLSVIWGIVDNHDGTIIVKSEVGMGTTFIIRLPE